MRVGWRHKYQHTVQAFLVLARPLALNTLFDLGMIFSSRSQNYSYPGEACMYSSVVVTGYS